ncbi:cobalamin-5'-phosphate synthase [Sphingomonas gellani]|uniref:Adenosylcobinamide-GDP ribazoletransferase n=1 Tax=Sphingomonas gellani TaxID=1166340 RepID=A0A1H8CRF6_9SPHN|nr:adenosylcobinamide-GDP ribazoletransferase [Sphingomonas gellani]SEM97615.1 cobalamin-5'-phosphate synthase [Sphingomonas gellani]
MRGFLLALGFLTRLPVPALVATDADFATAIRCYPLVGLVIGMLVAGAGWLGMQVEPWVGALAALATWVGVTGALHLDGLADLADGLGAAHGDRDRLIAVMADPHVGSFGVVALVMQLLAKLVLLHALLPLGWWPVALIPFASRIGPLLWARLLPPLKPGLGARVATAVRRRDLIGWALLLLAGAVAAPFLLAAFALIAGYLGWLRARLGGVNGDAHGAGIEIVEMGLLLAAVIVGTP